MRTISYTQKAKYNLKKILDYLEPEWSYKSREKFGETLKVKTKSIQQFPNSSPIFDQQRKLYKLVTTKQTSLFYRFNDSEITIITIIDNRMNPNRINKELD